MLAHMPPLLVVSVQREERSRMVCKRGDKSWYMPLPPIHPFRLDPNSSSSLPRNALIPPTAIYPCHHCSTTNSQVTTDIVFSIGLHSEHQRNITSSGIITLLPVDRIGPLEGFLWCLLFSQEASPPGLLKHHPQFHPGTKIFFQELAT